MSIKDIYCQNKAVSSLQHAFAADRVAHAYIFAGAEGIGKFRTAQAWAKLLLCKNRTQEDGFFDSCGLCDSCKSLEAESHPDFQHIYKELVNFAKSSKGKRTPVDLPIKVIREFLIEKINSRPILSAAKVYVISESEKLNRASQNALLKVLEEPPEYCSIILLCTKLEKLLPTTQSRCQIIRFGQIEEEIIVNKLKEVGISGPEAQYWARFTDGSLGGSLAWAKLESAQGSCYEVKKELVTRLVGYKLEDALDFAAWMSTVAKEITQNWVKSQENISKSDITRRVQRGLITMIIAAFADAMKLNAAGNGQLTNAAQTSQIETLAKRFTAEASAELIGRAYEIIGWIDASVNEKLIFEQLLITFAN